MLSTDFGSGKHATARDGFRPIASLGVLFRQVVSNVYHIPVAVMVYNCLFELAPKGANDQADRKECEMPTLLEEAMAPRDKYLGILTGEKGRVTSSDSELQRKYFQEIVWQQGLCLHCNPKPPRLSFTQKNDIP